MPLSYAAISSLMAALFFFVVFTLVSGYNRAVERSTNNE